MDFSDAITIKDYDENPRQFRRDYECKADPHFASVNMLKGYTPSRRDDLEQLAYLVLHLLCVGRIEDDTYWFKVRERPGEQDVTRIIDEKQSLAYNCNIPGLAKMLQYSQVHLQFEEEPDYDYYARLLDEIARPPEANAIMITDNNSNHDAIEEEAHLLNGDQREHHSSEEGE